MNEATAIIAAAGSGERLGAGGPKALVEVAGRPLIAWCLDAFAAAETIASVIVAAPPDQIEEIARLAADADVVAGGETRSESVAAALGRAQADVVAVHDAARPLVTPELIDACVRKLVDDPAAAGVIAAAPLTDTVKRARNLAVAKTEHRDDLWAAQTPQVFRTAALREAHAQDPRRLRAATDDAMLVEKIGGTILIEPAPAENLKVTARADLRLAELLLAERR